MTRPLVTNKEGKTHDNAEKVNSKELNTLLTLHCRIGENRESERKSDKQERQAHTASRRTTSEPTHLHAWQVLPYERKTTGPERYPSPRFHSRTRTRGPAEREADGGRGPHPGDEGDDKAFSSSPSRFRRPTERGKVTRRRRTSEHRWARRQRERGQSVFLVAVASSEGRGSEAGDEERASIGWGQRQRERRKSAFLVAVDVASWPTLT